MYLEVALSEEDDYIRLQKLSLGIKEIASIIPSVQTFGDMQTLKLLLCSYPFQQNSVELLISILFDRFKDVHFLQAFHSACTELAQLQEQRAFLSQRSLSLKSSRINASLNLSMEQKKISSNSSFSKAVIGKLLIAKKFCVSYLKPLFQLANDLGQDLEKFARIFKVFILNTKDQQFIYKIIAIFEECKNDIFGNRQWVSSYYEEIDQFFLQNHISIPSEKRESTILDRNSRVSFLPDNNNPNDADSDGSSEENVDDQFQQWLCCSETLEMSEKESLFKNPENFDEFLKYILQPENVELHGCWFEKYKNINFQKDSQAYYKVFDKQMKPEETIRSYKALQVLVKEENSSTLSQLVPQNLLHIFNAIYDSLLDQFHNANLNHIASLIESLLTRKPKLAAIQFVELNLFFSLSVYLYNPLISNILENIVNLTIDKYQLGCFFQEQVWKYLCKTEWFKFLTQLISGEHFNQKLIDKSTKSEATISTLSVLKTLSQYDKQQMIVNLIDLDQKQQLTNFLGMLQPGKSSEAYYTSNQLNWHLNSDVIEYISMTQINEKDIDNLSNFVDDRNTNVLIKKYFHEMKLMKSKKLIETDVQEQVKDHQEDRHQSLANNTLQVRNTKSKGSKTVISRRKSQVKVIQKVAQSSSSLQNSPTVHSPGLQTLTQVEGEDSVDEQNPAFRKQQKKFSFLYHSSTFRNRTEGNNNTNEGFSSSRLKTIYPSYKTSIQNTEYEKQFEHMAIDQKYFKEGINLLMLATKSQIDFLKSNNENVKQTLNRLDLSSICQNFLSETQLNKYFQVYMYDVLENKPSDNIGDDCGIFINFIMENIIELGQLEESRQAMCNSFIQVLEYFCKIIYMTHKNPNFLISTKHKFKKTLLMSTLTNGFFLLFINDTTIMQKMIIKHLNESVLHILTIWFFDSDQNNQYQRNFLVYYQQLSSFMNLFLNAAPQSMISSLFFKIGLIASLQNAYSKLFVNGIKNDSNHESLYFYIQMLIETILSVIRKRSLIQLEANLNSMESWHILTNNKSYREPKLIAKINESIAKNIKESEATSPAFLISSKQSYLSIHKEDSTNKRKQSHDVTYQRKSLLLGPKLIPISPGQIHKPAISVHKS